MECELLRSPMISYRSLLYNTTVLYDRNPGKTFCESHTFCNAFLERLSCTNYMKCHILLDLTSGHGL